MKRIFILTLFLLLCFSFGACVITESASEQKSKSEETSESISESRAEIPSESVSESESESASESEFAECPHQYEVTASTVTCLEDGSVTYRCTKCTDTYTEDVKAMGHDFGALSLDNDRVVRRCGRCTSAENVAVVDESVSATVGNSLSGIYLIKGQAGENAFLTANGNRYTVTLSQDGKGVVGLPAAVYSYTGITELISVSHTCVGTYTETYKATTEIQGILSRTCPYCGNTSRALTPKSGCEYIYRTLGAQSESNVFGFVVTVAESGIYRLSFNMTDTAATYVDITSSALPNAFAANHTGSYSGNTDTDGYLKNAYDLYLAEGDNTVSIYCRAEDTLHVEGVRYKLLKKVDAVTSSDGETEPTANAGHIYKLCGDGIKVSQTLSVSLCDLVVSESGEYDFSLMTNAQNGGEIQVKLKNKETGAQIELRSKSLSAATHTKNSGVLHDSHGIIALYCDNLWQYDGGYAVSAGGITVNEGVYEVTVTALPTKDIDRIEFGGGLYLTKK